jgi:DNA polymerase III sliding clamp (beta) subunit (PCNA family)
MEHLAAFKPVEFSGPKDGWIHFKNASGVLFSCRTVNEEYPDISAFIKSKGTRLSIPEHTLEVLDRAGIFTDEAQHNYYVDITLRGKAMVIKGKNQVGWLEERVTVDYTGEPHSFQINPKFLQEILKHHAEAIVSGQLLKFRTKDFVHCCVVVAPETNDA